MIEKEDWIRRHKNATEKEWKEFVQYCRGCGFKFGMNKNGQEVIYSPTLGTLWEKENK